MTEQNRIEPEFDNAGVKPIPPQVFGGALVLSILLDLAMPFTLLGGGGGGAFWGLLFCGAGGTLIYSCWKLFKAHGTNIRPDQPSSQLIQQGPYNYSRNPIYVALLLIYTGLALLMGNGWMFVFLPAILLYLRMLVIEREEAYLEHKFGDAYLAYRLRVGRWFSIT